MNDAKTLRARNREFDYFGIPVDVLWTDIEYAQDKKYFVFDPVRWPLSEVEQLNAEIEQSKRRLVAISDPHIKVDMGFWIYLAAKILEQQISPGNVSSIFVRQSDGKSSYEAYCWPGKSVWIDFLNPKAAQFWSDLYLYDKF
jgi:mannosyl-oligosaccharide alpha-1,3-glucosidase